MIPEKKRYVFVSNAIQKWMEYIVEIFHQPLTELSSMTICLNTIA